MNNETFNKNYGSLFSINKINQVFENTFDISKNSNINENNQKKFDFSMTKSKSIKNIKRINDSTKETGSISLKSLKPANDNNNSNIHDENNIPISNFLKYDLNCSKIANSKPQPFNIKKYFKSKTLKFIDFPQKSEGNKISSSKKVKINKNNEEDIIKEEEKTGREKFFETEINMDLSNRKDYITQNSIKNYNNLNESGNYQLNEIKEIKKKLTIDNKNNKNRKVDDPLLISKDDMIFEEMKKYKCFQYFTQDALNKTGVPFIYIRMNMNPDNKPLIDKNKNNSIEGKLYNSKYLVKLLRAGKDNIYLTKRYNRDLTDEKKREILENIYKVKNSPDCFKKIEGVKRKKDKKKLKHYQNNFLKIVKHNITNKYYEALKDKFTEIREEAKGKYDTNFKFLKEIEKNEENIIKNINQLYSSYTRYFAHKNINKIFVKSIGPRIKLPRLKFIKMVNKGFFTENEKVNNNKNKKNLINMRKFMNKTCNKINKDPFGISPNKSNTNRFYSTNYKLFPKYKYFSSKKL
jgi:hypothetical protein